MRYLTGLAIAALAGVAVAASSTMDLGEIEVEGPQYRERDRGPLRTIDPAYSITVRHEGDGVGFQVGLNGERQQQIRFRRDSVARQLDLDSRTPAIPARALRMEGDRVTSLNPDIALRRIPFTLEASIDEVDGLPAVMRFGPDAMLVNLDYMRLRDTTGDTGISVSFAIHPTTRRCEREFLLADDGNINPIRLVLLAGTLAGCRRVERTREGDLVFADSVPERLRQAVLEAYEPIASRLASRLGSEPGQVFVAWWPESPRGGYRFEPSWDRNSLLLFNGPGWQDGIDADQRQALWKQFAAEQIERRIAQSGTPDPFTGSAARYLQGLVTAEQVTGTPAWLAAELPGWIAGCSKDLGNKARVAASRGNVPSIDCGLLVQFVYDAVARADSAGGKDIYDTWRPLLAESYWRGVSGAKPADFLATSREAWRIAQGLLDGTVDWAGLAQELEGRGVQLRVERGGSGISVTLLSLQHFRY